MRAHGTWPSREPAARSLLYPIVRSFAEKKNADYCGVGIDGTGPCVSVKGRLADAAALGLQPINCKQNRREQRIRPLAFVTHTNVANEAQTAIGMLRVQFF